MGIRRGSSLLFHIAWLGVLASAPRLAADPLDDWTPRYPLPQGNALLGITCGNGVFVAVGAAGTILTSGDGYSWTNQSWRGNATLSGVTYAGGLFVAVGSAGTIITSSNGVSWTQQTSGTSNTLSAVAGDPGFPKTSVDRFLAVGAVGTVLSSTNGFDWLLRDSGTSCNLNAVDCYEGSYTIVGDAGTVIMDWIGLWFPAESRTTGNLLAVAGSGDAITAGGDLVSWSSDGSHLTNSILYSIDWTDWDAQTFIDGNGLTPYAETFLLHGMAFGAGLFVAVGDPHGLEADDPGVVLTSSTGTEWALLPESTSLNIPLAVTYGNGRFIAVGEFGTIITSLDGTNWTQVSSYSRSAITAIACTESLCIASGEPMNFNAGFPNFTSLVSTDGVNWAEGASGLPTFYDLVGAGTRFVGVGKAWETGSSCICTTTNGFDWVTQASASNLNGVGYGNGLFVAVGWSGQIYTSQDGLGWSNRSVATTGGFNCVTYGKGLYVAAGTAVATSTDGVSWSLAPINPPTQLIHMVYANGRFVATGGQLELQFENYPSGVLTSADGVNWALQATDWAPWSIAYGNGEFLAVALESDYWCGVFKSSDGLNWTGENFVPWLYGTLMYYTYPIYYPRPGICAHNGRFLVGWLDGRLIESGDTRVPVVPGSAAMTQAGFSFSCTPMMGYPYRVQASTNLDLWEDVCQSVASQQPTVVTNSTGGAVPYRFFRAVSP